MTGDRIPPLIMQILDELRAHGILAHQNALAGAVFFQDHGQPLQLAFDAAEGFARKEMENFQKSARMLPTRRSI